MKWIYKRVLNKLYERYWLKINEIIIDCQCPDGAYKTVQLLTGTHSEECVQLFMSDLKKVLPHKEFNEVADMIRVLRSLTYMYDRL